jgi:hypothetical protein
VSDIRTTRAERFRALIHGRGAAYAATLGAAALLVAGAARHATALMLLGPPAVLAATAVACWAAATRRAQTDFFTSFANGLGLSHHAIGELPAYLPLLAAGDRREATHVMDGEIAGVPLTLANYAFEVHHEAGSSELVTEHRRFTVCVLAVAAPPGLDAGVFLHRRRDVVDRLTGADWLEHAEPRRIELESSAFAERYDLWAAEGTEDVALHQLFAPSFLDWIAEHPLGPGFEYQAGVLAVYVERELEDAGTLTFLLDAARHVAARFKARTSAAGAAYAQA